MPDSPSVSPTSGEVPVIALNSLQSTKWTLKRPLPKESWAWIRNSLSGQVAFPELWRLRNSAHWRFTFPSSAWTLAKKIYFSRLLKFLKESEIIETSLFATLNYECLFEQAATYQGLSIDYHLQSGADRSLGR